MPPIQATKLIISLMRMLPAFLLGGCSPLELVNSASKIYNIEIKENLSFGENPKLKYDLYLPNQSKENLDITPVIVFFFGGSWNRGDKSEYEFVGRRLANMGYITAIPNYRVYPEVKYPDFLNDSSKSIAHLKKELEKKEYLKYKPSGQYIIMGHSAGAYNAAMLAFDDRWLKNNGLEIKNTIKGFIGLAGAYNIYPINDQEVRPVFSHPNYPPQSQPIDFTKQWNPPSLILTPETDTLVNIERNSEALHNALLLAGNYSSRHVIRGTDHITIVGTLSPVLFFKGSTIKPISEFVQKIYLEQ
jgi:acetyl esterase/lipase